MHALEVARQEAARKYNLLHKIVQEESRRTKMPRPLHVTLMHLLREIERAGVTEEAVIVELQADNFDVVLQHLQDKPGRVNQPTNVEENMFYYGEVEVRRV